MAKVIHYDDHPNKVLQYLDQQRRAGEPYCDITVKMEGRHFSAHKTILCASSGYFQTLFKAQTGETREVELSGLTMRGFSAMLEMMYTSQLQVTTANVMDVQVAASYLHMMDVVADCTRFLTTSLAAGHLMTDTNTGRVLHYPSHPTKVLRHLNSLRKERHSSCGLTITVENQRFLAHKVILMSSSGYFRTILNGEQNMNELELNGLTKRGFSAMLDMMYTSQLHLSAHNVIDVQVSASYLHMMEVVADCTQFLTESIMSGRMANYLLINKDYRNSVTNLNGDTTSATTFFHSRRDERAKDCTDNPKGIATVTSASATAEHFQTPSPVQAHSNWAHCSSSLRQSTSNSEVIVVKREVENLEDVVRTTQGNTQQQTSALCLEEVYMDSGGVGDGEEGGRGQSQTSQMSNVYGNACQQQEHEQGIQELQTNVVFSGSCEVPGVLSPPQPQFYTHSCEEVSDVMTYTREHMLDRNGTHNVARNWFRRVVRETVKKYQITGLRSVHIDDAVKEVLRRCPSLELEDVWDIRRQIRTFISNKSGHLSRKVRGYLVPSKRGQRRSQDGASTPLSPTGSTSSANILSSEEGGEESMESHEIDGEYGED